jgi:RNA polymerase sigma-70 factor (ECF subfamily)
MHTLTYNIKSEEKSRVTLTLANMDEEALIFAKVKEGDEAAFESLFRKYYARLCRFAFKYVEDMSEAEELVQDTFVKIWEKRESIEINTSFKSYLYQAVTNKGLNAIRNDQRKQRNLKIVSSNRNEPPKAIDNLVTNEISDKLFLALNSLPPKCRKIFQLSRLEGLNHKEIAQQLDIKIKTVENQIGIALKHLKKQLSEHLLFLVLFISSINI